MMKKCYKNYKDTYDYEDEKEADILVNIINERYNKDVSIQQLVYQVFIID